MALCAVGSLVTGYLALCVLLFAAQRSLLFPAPREPAQPVLVVHGTRDEVVPFELGQALAEKLPQARFVEAPGAGHNAVWDVAAARDEVFRFVRAP
ncbi:MAG: alpha/beta fold hydrolase [Myxococcota bacterium]|jgi:pimeloyl-ACP methyl ester carboxylesterase